MNRLRMLVDLCQPAGLLQIVDVGANPTETPTYRPLVDVGAARVTGFEPQASAFAELEDKQSDHERYLPYAVGDGGAATLNVCRASGFTSLLTPDPQTMAYFGRWGRMTRVVEKVDFETKRLDDMAELERVDLLMIDIQGGEVAVFDNAGKKLASAVAVITEAAFYPIYVDQPLLDDQMKALRRSGFALHKLLHTKSVKLNSPDTGRFGPAFRNQLVDGDAVFIRDMRDPGALDDEQLKRLAILADTAFSSFDLTVLCLAQLRDRGVLETDAIQDYVDLVPGAAAR
ncbi:MAG: FkbM family methyltransferase [Pseudomonadota bacterium]